MDPIKAEELRLGNVLLCHGEIAIVNAHMIKQCVFESEDFNQHYKPMVLTERVMRQLRRRVRPDFEPIEFRGDARGERQGPALQWRSRDLHDGFAGIHMTASYHSMKVYADADAETRDMMFPDFWFIWLDRRGTGSHWFLSLVEIHGKGRIRYVHELQNLFYWIEREGLVLRSKNYIR